MKLKDLLRKHPRISLGQLVATKTFPAAQATAEFEKYAKLFRGFPKTAKLMLKDIQEMYDICEAGIKVETWGDIGDMVLRQFPKLGSGCFYSLSLYGKNLVMVVSTPADMEADLRKLKFDIVRVSSYKDLFISNTDLAELMTATKKALYAKDASLEYLAEDELNAVPKDEQIDLRL